MTGHAATALAVALLAAVLVVAVWRPRGAPEAVAAIPAAALVVGTGLLAWPQALTEVVELGPTVGFLAAVLVLAHLADAEGVFTWAGSLLRRRRESGFSDVECLRCDTADTGNRLFRRVFALAAVTTAVLSLDATVVLLTPVVVRTARRMRLAVAPAAFVCAHLANSASLLLPVSNLTNLLAVGATHLSFLRFAALMALPWVVVLAVEYVGLRWVFRREIDRPEAGPEDEPDRPDQLDQDTPTPRYALVVLALTLVGFGAAAPLGVEPVWVAVVGVVVLGARSLASRRTTPRAVVESAAPLFCLFVLALGVVVAAVGTHGLGGVLTGIVTPLGTGLPGLLAVAGLAAVLANVVNNLPATLLLLDALGPAPATATVLAMLIGVGVGPNLTYVGSLATLLWRRVMSAEGAAPSLRRFTIAGLVTTPAALVAGTVALWLVA
ncbi:ArsB/NhaD family transporter [Actinomycetospora sp. TBRC 11914]|uniref:ArsB/NhaD family transporter n=1 Tax=Actinomycetospora sp. TBRC 11914 TaxID=2729387 RepID=UPI00145D9480|nr:ArsB/NhaD family transporter [Actinomycetospora sp. TBRC 11914]NMO90518.1 arsenic transporter [Actinomycetospora sp. TBRC 11914]